MRVLALLYSRLANENQGFPALAWRSVQTIVSKFPLQILKIDEFVRAEMQATSHAALNHTLTA